MQEALQIALQGFNIIVMGYYGFVNVLYTLLLIISVLWIVRQRRKYDKVDYSPGFDLERAPPISVLLPVYNAQSKVVQTVKSLLTLNYPSFEILVINDGSNDETLKRLLQEFNLPTVQQIYRPVTRATQPVLGFYKNPELPAITVIDKRHGGKADSLNVGINVSQNPYFCWIDVDTCLEENALTSLIRPVLETLNWVVACAAIVGVTGEFQEDGLKISIQDLPQSTSGRLKVTVYLQRYLFGHMTWGYFRSLVAVSQECVLFQKRAVHSVGGYDLSTAAPNVELLLRLHRVLLKRRLRYEVVFNPVLIGWRIVSSGTVSLCCGQRYWHAAITGCLLKYKGMAFNPRYGMLGLIVLPLLWVTEIIGPFLETFGYISIGLSIWYGWIGLTALLFFFFLSVIYRGFLSVGCVIAEAALYRWHHLSSSIQLIFYAILEHLGYRQFMDWCRLWAVVRALSVNG
jgi:glycosyltransferase involved in cell wall biosynthesis